MRRNRLVNRGMEVSKAKYGDAIDLQKFTCGFPPDALPLDTFISDPHCCPLVHFNCKYGDKRVFNFALHADGACLDNGSPAARASVGVYGTPGAWYNEGSRLPPSVPQTNQSAEIYSAIAAIKVARAILKEQRPDLGKCGCPTVVVILMDSRYVVCSMTNWIRRWRVNGFLDVNGSPVVNTEAFKRLDQDIRQAYIDRYIIIRFCQIPREYNSGADIMAAQAFRTNRFLDLSPAALYSN